MYFTPLVEVAGDLLLAVSGLGIFRKVRMAAIGSYEQLYKLLPDLSEFPAAIVCIGEVGYLENYAVRTLTPAIIVIDKLRLSAEGKATGIWELANTVLARFEPDLFNESVEINGNYYYATGARPLALSGEYAATIIELSAVIPARQMED